MPYSIVPSGDKIKRTLKGIRPQGAKSEQNPLKGYYFEKKMITILSIWLKGQYYVK